jgi:predicted lipoprotein with Yx(FWY)xxD motif
MIRRAFVFLAAAMALAVLALLRLTGGAHAYDTSLRYPSEVALSLEGEKGYVFRRFPGSQRLYTYDKDKPTRSACNIGCDGAHMPVLAPADAMVMDEWSIIDRDDGTRQWAFRGKPIYTAFHDPAGDPRGDGEDGVWHLVPYEK